MYKQEFFMRMLLKFSFLPLSWYLLSSLALTPLKFPRPMQFPLPGTVILCCMKMCYECMTSPLGDQHLLFSHSVYIRRLLGSGFDPHEEMGSQKTRCCGLERDPCNPDRAEPCTPQKQGSRTWPATRVSSEKYEKNISTVLLRWTGHFQKVI